MMRKSLAILICVAAAWLIGPVAAEPTSECLLGLRESLIEGGFSGPLVCSKSDATFELVGRTSEDRYAIYDYRYRYLPQNGNVMHGGQKIIVFQDRRYVGQYSLSPPPYESISVWSMRVIVHSQDNKRLYYLDFTNGPPREAFIDDEILSFYR